MIATIGDLGTLLVGWMFLYYRKRIVAGDASLACLDGERRVGFDNFRKSLEDLMNRATPPADRREIATNMRETLVQAKMGLAEMRESLEKGRKRLILEERELETVRRRRQLAQDIGDTETVTVADKYEATHAERVELLRRKVAIQEEEVRLAESDVESMSRDLRAAMSGTGDFAPHVPTSVAPDLDTPDAPLANEIDALGRARARAERNADAEAKLEELKRRMGK